MKEGLWMHLARTEKKLAAEEGRDPKGWIWTEDMDAPRHIDFEKIEDEKEEETPDD